jgi:multisubunit Na+/H+ antiporter MnhB subunit
MNSVTAFVAGLVVTMGVVFLVLSYLRNPLQVILTDLCGTSERARFWTAFSNITLFLVPFVLALDHRPAPDGIQSSVFAISDQIESAVIGLIVSTVILGMVLSWHITRSQLSKTLKGIDAQRSSSQTNATTI